MSIRLDWVAVSAVWYHTAAEFKEINRPELLSSYDDCFRLRL